MQGAPGQGSGPQTPGFLTVPGNQCTPAIGAGSAIFYDKQLDQWIPRNSSTLSPDGTSYVYLEGDVNTSRIHLVNIRTKADVVLASGGPWQGVGFDADWFYVMRLEFVDSAAYGRLGISKGLWKVPLAGGSPVQLTSDARGWVAVAHGGVYGAGITGDVAGGPNDVGRLDVKTMQITTWFDKHARSRVLAVEANGAALVMTEAGAEEMWWVTAPGSAGGVWSGPTDAVRPGPP